MSLLGIDLGGTKLSLAIFTEEGEVLHKETIPLNHRKGAEVGELITEQISKLLNSKEIERNDITSIGICIPGINHSKTGTVWVPNIQGWGNYALLEEVKTVTGNIPVTIDCDRACYILGELWQGNAKGCRDAIFLAIGTGIGAGILANGSLLRGAHNVSGAIGWMALNKPFEKKYLNCGCFEHYASGGGIAMIARELLKEQKAYKGELKKKEIEKISSQDVFTAYKNKDTIAVQVIESCIEYWGMAVANLISLFDPEKIIFGGGVFGPAIGLIPFIKKEAYNWAQPVSINLVSLEASSLGGDAGVYGAGFLALQNLKLNRVANV
ncbi:MAG: hypothetical protein JWQ09_4121 [Segetibacter sp.]|nr:hypothetical protein [Segetibacter sp.]